MDGLLRLHLTGFTAAMTWKIFEMKMRRFENERGDVVGKDGVDATRGAVGVAARRPVLARVVRETRID